MDQKWSRQRAQRRNYNSTVLRGLISLDKVFFIHSHEECLRWAPGDLILWTVSQAGIHARARPDKENTARDDSKLVLRRQVDVVLMKGPRLVWTDLAGNYARGPFSWFLSLACLLAEDNMGLL
jgi:hypothetical protein